jgi:hypothetical protein
MPFLNRGFDKCEIHKYIFNIFNEFSVGAYVVELATKQMYLSVFGAEAC